MMKNINSNLEADIADRDERAKKLYRYISDTARRIDERSAACKQVVDLFATTLEVYRQKLRDNCEKLILLEPLAYGRKGLELLWRKAYYETVTAAKRLRRDDHHDPHVLAHLACGIGHFHQLIARIQMETGLRLESDVDYPPIDVESDSVRSVTDVDEDLIQWGRSMIHSCLIYLGDLCRYKMELLDDCDASPASRYYLQAAALDLTAGMPHNQLGTLYTGRNYDLDSVRCYIHCLNCSLPFEGAEGNLVRSLEKNAALGEDTRNGDADRGSQKETVKRFIHRFLLLTDYWFFQKEHHDAEELCNGTLRDLKECLFFEMLPLPNIERNYEEYTTSMDDEAANPSYLSTDVLHGVVEICLFCIDKLDESDRTRAFTTKAFLLALFSQLLQKLLQTLHSFGFVDPSVNKTKHMNGWSNQQTVEPKNDSRKNGIIQKDVVPSPSEGVKSNGHFSVDSGDEAKRNNTGEKTQVKKTNALKSIRRRRRARCSDSSDMSAEEEDNIGGVLGEDTVVSEDDDSVASSELSDDCEDDSGDSAGNDSQDEVKSDVEEHELNGTSNKIPAEEPKNAEETKPSKSEVEELNQEQISKFMKGNNFLPTIKLIQDWVIKETHLVVSCGRLGDALFKSIVDILNIFQVNFCGKHSPKLEVQHCPVLDCVRDVAASLGDTYRRFPLPEDTRLRGTTLCRFERDATVWDGTLRHERSILEENVIRILHIIDFGHLVTRTVPCVHYNRSLQIFYIKKNTPTKKSGKSLSKRGSKEWKETKQKRQVDGDRQAVGEGSLVRALGKLWLAAQVRELESATRRAPPPPYLALDAAALCHHLSAVKQLVAARKFILLVPTVVVQSIDEMKKECSSARAAIRWLETQLRGGSRFLRTQRPTETRVPHALRVPRKLSRDAHTFLQIVQFCHYFVAEDDHSARGGEGDAVSTEAEEERERSAAVVVLLTGTRSADAQPSECKDFSYSGLARSAGVTVEHIEDFYGKWRHCFHRSKKR